MTISLEWQNNCLGGVLEKRNQAQNKGQINIVSLEFGRKMDGFTLNKIAKKFGLNHYGTVSGVVARFDQQINGNLHLAELIYKVDELVSK